MGPARKYPGRQLNSLHSYEAAKYTYYAIITLSKRKILRLNVLTIIYIIHAVENGTLQICTYTHCKCIIEISVNINNTQVAEPEWPNG